MAESSGIDQADPKGASQAVRRAPSRRRSGSCRRSRTSRDSSRCVSRIRGDDPDNGNWVSLEATVNYMDNDLCEEIHAELSPCKDQAFFDAYFERHEEKFGEDFVPAIDC